MIYSHYILLFALLLAIIASGESSHANPKLPDRSSPIYMEAEKLGYDQKNGIVIAMGNVEIVQGSYILFADHIAYYQDENRVMATGNISLMQPDGHVVFADKMELQDDLKKGIVKDINIRMANNALFAAREAKRINDEQTVLKKAVFSPCEVCESEDGSPSAPLWQLKASKVTINEEREKIYYEDAFVEIYGVPVLYAPYLFHPTPNASSQSGLLVPEYERSNQLGFGIRVPVYLALSPDKDATITPRYTSKEGLVMEAQYRQRTDKGYFEFNGSGTFPSSRDADGNKIDGNDFRGHIFAFGSSAIDEYWRWGFDIENSSDDTYLERYGYSSQDLLTSTAQIERLEGRDYFRIQGVGFQGLEEDDDPDVSPLIVPAIDWHVESDPMFNNSRFYMDQNAFFLTRRTGAETARLSVKGGYKIPYTTDSGHAFEFDASIRGDGYYVTERQRGSDNETSEDEQRVIPEASLSWRYPMLARVADASLVIEPQAKIVASSRGNNSSVISNEDSQIAEFDGLNLFSSRRYSGIDRVEDGTRLIYGFRTQLQTDGSNNINFLLGQEIQLDGRRLFPSNNNPNEDLSDIVGQLNIDYDPFVISYGFLMDEENLELNRNEIGASLDYGAFSMSLDYIDLKDDLMLGTREEISGAGSLQLTDSWRIFASGQRNLTDDTSTYFGGGFEYSTRCITVTSSMRRTFIRDRDIEPDISYLIRLSLSNLN